MHQQLLPRHNDGEGDRLARKERKKVSHHKSFGRLVLVAVTVIVCIVIPLVFTGCKSVPEEVAPPIKPWQSNSSIEIEDIPSVTAEPDPLGVELLGVSLGAGASFISVAYKAPPSAVETWTQSGSVYVIDEASGTGYGVVPVMPSVGPLFGKPQEAGQIAYVMLDNPGFGVRPGSLVTVVLGSYKREHVKVQ